jgi:hypothetical protein
MGTQITHSAHNLTAEADAINLMAQIYSTLAATLMQLHLQKQFNFLIKVVRAGMGGNFLITQSLKDNLGQLHADCFSRRRAQETI